MRSALLASITFTQTAPEGTSLKSYQVGSQSVPNTSLLVPIQLLFSIKAFDLVPSIIDNCDFLSRLCTNLQTKHQTILISSVIKERSCSAFMFSLLCDEVLGMVSIPDIQNLTYFK
jgi:hypothetical protein